MRGDVLRIEAHHREAAEALADLIAGQERVTSRRVAIGIAGESGSGKSELAQALQDALQGRTIASVILQQDDYFRYPPKTNDRRRREDINSVGPQEVDLERLNQDVEAILAGASSIEKPLVDYARDCIEQEKLSTDGCQVILVEGTYVSLLPSLWLRVFINLDFHQTLEARRRRDRDRLDPFGERVLAIEHEVISRHRNLASVLITSDFSVELITPLEQQPKTAQLERGKHAIIGNG